MESLFVPWRNLFTRALACGNRLIAALTDPRARERNVLWVFLAYLAIWTLYAIIEKSSQDINFDMAEIVIWSRELAAGNPTHPPLASWIAALWFAIFPYKDWAYYLLAIASATSALWISWSFSKRWLDPEKRVAGLAMLMLVPFFNFLAIKYNTNSVLLPFWALTTYCFLISYSTRSPLFAALAGAGAGACMLGKYWAIFLIAGLGIAAILDTRRKDYFRSPAPWITIAAGSIVIAPHIVWLFGNNFSSLAYPMGNHGGLSLSQTAHKVIFYVLGFAAYISAPVLFVLLAARPDGGAIKDLFWPKVADRRLASLAFWLPVALPIPVVFLIHADLTPIWTMSAVGLLPVILLSSERIIVARNAIAAIVVLAMALPVAALALSPGIAAARYWRGVGHYAGHYRLLANSIESNWREVTSQPLRLVGGSHTLADTAAFYIPDKPSTLNVFRPWRTAWADEARIKREGIAIICASEHQQCIEKLDAFARAAPASRRSEFTLTGRYLWMKGAPASYTLLLVAPETGFVAPVPKTN
jgi:hypothetical protein